MNIHFSVNGCPNVYHLFTSIAYLCYFKWYNGNKRRAQSSFIILCVSQAHKFDLWFLASINVESFSILHPIANSAPKSDSGPCVAP